MANRHTAPTKQYARSVDALLIIVKAPPRVCMENTRCQEANTAQGKAECCIFIHTSIGGAFKCFIVLPGHLAWSNFLEYPNHFNFW